MKIEGNMKFVMWGAIGLVIGIVVGLVWHLLDPSLALWFWPVFGALVFGQHAYRSHRRNDGDKPESAPPTR